MKSVNGLGILGNEKGKLRSWWMPRWSVCVRMLYPAPRVEIVINTKTPFIHDLPVIVRDDEVVGIHLGTALGYIMSNAVEGQKMTEKEKCEWKILNGIDNDCWLSSCGHEWEFIEGTPKDNEMIYCPFCGKLLIEIQHGMIRK